MDKDKNQKADLGMDLENAEKDKVTGIRNADLREDNDKPVVMKKKGAAAGSGKKS